MLKITSKSVSVSIWVRKKSTLEHFIVWGFNTWNSICRSKSSLFNFGKVVVWISVECNFANRNKRIIFLWPYFGNIKYVKSVVFSILFWHKLNVPCPWRETSFCNIVKKISSRIVRICFAKLSSFRTKVVFNTLICFEVILYIMNISFIINPFISVGTISIHVSKSIRSSTIRKQDCDLMKCLRTVAPEVPCHIWIR